ncbi:high-potential iron-sulfur protein [Falsiroseomonas sp.]
MSKETANYQDNPKDGQRCAGCRYFSAPDQCSVVIGDVSADGWCRFWRAG